MNIPITNEITVTLIAITCLLIIAERMISFWKNHMKEQPTPADTYATKAEHQELKEEVSDLRAGLDELKSEFQKDFVKMEARNEERASRLHKRIDPVVEHTAAIRGEMSAFRCSFEQFTQIVTSLADNKK